MSDDKFSEPKPASPRTSRWIQEIMWLQERKESCNNELKEIEARLGELKAQGPKRHGTQEQKQTAALVYSWIKPCAYQEFRDCLERALQYVVSCSAVKYCSKPGLKYYVLEYKATNGRTYTATHDFRDKRLGIKELIGIDHDHPELTFGDLLSTYPHLIRWQHFVVAQRCNK